MCSISLCIIVKNEENNIKSCLESAVSLVDEIIIVDTGSTDLTKSICQTFHAKIYDFEWNGNFSAARNFCISKASSEWILWLDADEQINLNDREFIHNVLRKKDINLFSIEMHHIVENSPPKADYYISYNYRLFRNNKNFYFDGAIHEKLINSDIEEMDKFETISNLFIDHYGYNDSENYSKSLRNLEILTKEKEKDESNPWYYYHIASELYKLNEITKSYYFVNNAILMFIKQNLLPPSLAYKLKYDIIVHFYNLDNALTGINKAIELYPDYVELYFYRGLILYHNQQYEDSINSFTKCIALGEFNPNYLIGLGTGSYKAFFHIGRCYEKLNRYEQAKESYKQSLQSNSTYKPSLENINNLP